MAKCKCQMPEDLLERVCKKVHQQERFLFAKKIIILIAVLLVALLLIFY